MKQNSVELRIGRRTVSASNLDKVFYPETGFTKGQMIDYYIRVSPYLLPHLKDRPVSLKRYPNGVKGLFFYEKRCPTHRPDWLKIAPVWSEGNQDIINFCVFNDLPSLVWAANIAVLEIHTYLAKMQKILQPTMIAFDLDPGPPADVVSCARVALWVREKLEQVGLKSFPKTSGSKGMQIYIPLNTPGVTFDDTKSFARWMAQTLEAEHREHVVSKMRKDLRSGKVFIDWSQNDDSKTTVCVYSLRAKDEPTVSTPLQWEEVEEALEREDPESLKFTSDMVLKRVEQHGDLFAPVLKLKQRLPAAAVR